MYACIKLRGIDDWFRCVEEKERKRMSERTRERERKLKNANLIEEVNNSCKNIES